MSLVGKVAGQAGKLTQGLTQGIATSSFTQKIGAAIQNHMPQFRTDADGMEDCDTKISANWKPAKNTSAQEVGQNFQKGRQTAAECATTEVYRCFGDEEGVVAMMVLPLPCMLCAIFSDG